MKPHTAPASSVESQNHTLSWSENGASKNARWRSANGTPPPKRLMVADDRMGADQAWRLACEGCALLWRGDFQNARQLLQAIARRIDAKTARMRNKDGTVNPLPLDASRFHLYRQAQSQRARTLAMLLIPFEGDHHIPLGRAPDVQAACGAVFGRADGQPYVCSLRELLGLIGAFEWRKKGVEVRALGGRIHPHFGVFAPTRGEYIDLVARAPLPAGLTAHALAYDIGTGSGVLAALLARRGVAQVIATDVDERALACARENIQRLGLAGRVEVVNADLFPAGRAALAVCNPPWIPARPSTSLERAVYDPDSRMLRGFLDGLSDHLMPNGEGWLILSDLAEHLGLRSRETLLEWIAAARLRVIDRIDTRPHHPRAADVGDALHAARSIEITSLWRLVRA